MINLMLLVAVAAAGPIKMDGANVPAADLVTSGAVSFKADSATINGGRVELGAARQKALDAKLAGPSSVVIYLVDGSSADTTVFTFGQMRLVRKLGTWFIVNTTGGLWRQVDLGPTTKGANLKLAIVENVGQAHIYRDGKDFGTTPYEVGASQPFAIGSPGGEATPWTGELKSLEFLGKALTLAEVAARFPADATTPAAPVVTDPKPTPVAPKPATGPAEAQTKSTVVVADLVALTEVPDPQSILPYRHAIVTHEYKVIEVKSGHIDKVIPQAIIRVARWGVLGSKKTDIANLKKGDRVELTLEKYSDHPDLEHFYTVDTLPDNYSAPYLLDTAKKAPGTGG